MNSLWYVLTFLLGTTIGSFVNVFVSRSIKGIDWRVGRSRCDFCDLPLKPYDMVPLASFLVLGGKSRCCHRQLSWQHPIVEAIFGLLFVWWLAVGVAFFHLVSHPLVYLQPGFWLVMGSLLVVVAVADIFYGLIPIVVVYVGMGMTLLYRGILWIYGWYGERDLGLSLLVGGGSAGLIWLLRWITKGRGMGEGDIYLALWIGLLLGWPRGLVALWIAFVLGAVVGGALVVAGRKRYTSTIAFGPFLVIGALLALVGGTGWWELIF